MHQQLSKGAKKDSKHTPRGKKELIKKHPKEREGEEMKRKQGKEKNPK